MNRQMESGQFQNVQRQPNDESLARKKNSVRGLAKLEMFFTILCTTGGVIEITSSSNCGYYYYCYDNPTIGHGVYCSIIPFIAAILGLKASRPFASRTQITLFTVFSILGALSMATMAIIETLYLSTYYQSINCVMAGVSFFNMMLLIISSSYSCSMGCCHQENSTAVYVGSPHGGGPVYRIPADGMYNNPQMVASHLPPYQPQYGENLIYPPNMTSQQPHMMSQPPHMTSQQPHMMSQPPHMMSQQPQMTLPPSYEASTNPSAPYHTNEIYEANEEEPPKYQPNAEC